MTHPADLCAGWVSRLNNVNLRTIHMHPNTQPQLKASHAISRRQMLASTTGLSAALLAGQSPAFAAQSQGKAVKNGQITQSIAQWCFEMFGGKWKLEKTCQVARELGCKSVELLTADLLP